MGCLGWCKRRRSRSGGSSSSTSGKRGGASVSGPATTTMTTTTTATTATTASAVSTSRSDDSGAVRPVSKSAGSGSSQVSQRSISSLYEERGHGQLRVFDYEELQAATAEFSRAQKLGEGGFGSVYKGFIRAADGKGDRVPVAVKKLNQRGMQPFSVPSEDWESEKDQRNGLRGIRMGQISTTVFSENERAQHSIEKMTKHVESAHNRKEASRRGEYLILKRLGQVSSPITESALANKFDALFGGNPEDDEALRELFPDGSNVGGRKRRRCAWA